MEGSSKASSDWARAWLAMLLDASSADVCTCQSFSIRGPRCARPYHAQRGQFYGKCQPRSSSLSGSRLLVVEVIQAVPGRTALHHISTGERQPGEHGRRSVHDRYGPHYQPLAKANHIAQGELVEDLSPILNAPPLRVASEYSWAAFMDAVVINGTRHTGHSSRCAYPCTVSLLLLMIYVRHPIAHPFNHRNQTVAVLDTGTTTCQCIGVTSS